MRVGARDLDDLYAPARFRPQVDSAIGQLARNAKTKPQLDLDDWFRASGYILGFLARPSGVPLNQLVSESLVKHLGRDWRSKFDAETLGQIDQFFADNVVDQRESDREDAE